MKIGHFSFVDFTELVKELGSTRFRVEKTLRSPLVQEGVHFCRQSPQKRYYNVELIRDLSLNYYNPEKHQEAINEFKAQASIQKAIPSIREDSFHVA